MYCNDGDWVENCTVLVETRSGELQLWDWAERHLELSGAQPAAPSVRAA